MTHQGVDEVPVPGHHVERQIAAEVKLENRTLRRRMLAMICRLFATRCCISCNSISFCRRSSAISRSVARRSVYIFDRQENELASIPLTNHLARVQEHRASADFGTRSTS